MSKKTLSLILLGVLILAVCPLGFVSATDWGYGNISITGLIDNALSFTWIVFCAIAVLMFVSAGILFLSAQGEPDKITTARHAFFWGVAGVVVAILAYSIITILGNFFNR